MRFEIFFYAVFAAGIWGFIWHQAVCKSPWGFVSPKSLLVFGIFFYYIIPSLYWSFRSWQYYVPPYFEGLPLVLGNVIIFGLPFLAYAMFGKKKARPPEDKITSLKLQYSAGLWLLAVPAAAGILIRIYFIQSGWIARLGREFPILFGSQNFTMILANFTYYIACTCFIFILFGNKTLRRSGWILWGVEGLLRLLTFQRKGIVRFVFLSFVLGIIKGGKITVAKAAGLAGIVLLVLSILGAAQHLVFHRIQESGRQYMTLEDTISVLWSGAEEYSSNTIQGKHISEERNFLLRSLDDALYRMYDARSASAVMAAIPELLPFSYGATFLNVLYTFIPRYFWRNKPDMADVHHITNEIMYPERGNPLGTIAEFYLSCGYVAVFFGGLVFLLICNGFDFLLDYRKNYLWPAIICSYPILSEQFVYASFNASQRICELLRGFIVVGMIAGVLWLFKIKLEKIPGEEA
ncbi:MAG: hypothetical protein PHH77_02875 [Victivallaceae bacterium]|nr:hypothetical protein [Victivallaceae bacterium]